MKKRLSLIWLILSFLLTSCSMEVWYENIKCVKFSTLGTILCIALLAGFIVWLGYSLLSKCIIPYFASMRIRSYKLWRWVENHLTGLFYTAWGFGFITYFVGSFVGDTPAAYFTSVLSSAPMAAVYATLMFIGQSDISAVFEPMQNNPIYIAMFGLSNVFTL